MIPANYSLARNMARKVLKQYKILDVPTDLQRICVGEGLEYMELDDPEAVDGMLMVLEDGTRVAMVNRAKAYVRGRFTLAHELGHIRDRKSTRRFRYCFGRRCRFWPTTNSRATPPTTFRTGRKHWI